MRGTPALALLDTALGSDNEGDQIIVDAVLDALPGLREVPRLPTHRRLSRGELALAARTRFLFLAGTNALTSTVRPATPWRLGPAEMAAFTRKVIPIGVGWRDYERPATLGRAVTYKALFASGVPVSVRDSHAQSMLTNAGIESINTGCPTMWSLPDTLPAYPPTQSVVATVTDYKRSADEDGYLLRELARRFEHVTVWPQSDDDVSYLSTLALDERTTIAQRGLAHFHTCLDDSLYVGTRLHAGIRALQRSRPALIVAVDNRAQEIAHDTGLRVIARDQLRTGLDAAVPEAFTPQHLRLPHENQKRWLQLVDAVAGPGLH
jgi:polysaccharide pyruvyl transferase WcaK-like protein